MKKEMQSIDDKKRILARAFWDRDIDPALLNSFINGDIDTIPLVSSRSIYLKLLSSFDWYTLLSLLPEKALKKALSDEVLDNLFPKSRKEKYKYARQILFP